MWDREVHFTGLYHVKTFYMSKRMKAAQAQIEKGKVYPLEEAIALVQATGKTNFDGSVEVHARLGIDPKKGDQQIRVNLTLPHGTGKSKKVAAFVSANNEAAAKSAGADFVYGEDDIQTIKTTGKVEFDVAVATPEMMPKLAAAARVLGPRGLMPNPKTDTVGTDLSKMIGDIKKGKTAFKNDATSNIHQVVGKVSFTPEQLKENVEFLIAELKKAKPQAAKGTYIKSLFITSTMGPSVKISA